MMDCSASFGGSDARFGTAPPPPLQSCFQSEALEQVIYIYTTTCGFNKCLLSVSNQETNPAQAIASVSAPALPTAQQ